MKHRGGGWYEFIIEDEFFFNNKYMGYHNNETCKKYGYCSAGAAQEPTRIVGVSKEPTKVKSNDPWDNLKVGDILTNASGSYQTTVQALVGDLIAFKRKEDCEIVWETLKRLKAVYGWTIKDSTPKEEKKVDIANEIVNHFFGKGAVVGKSDYDFVEEQINKARTGVTDPSRKDKTTSF